MKEIFLENPMDSEKPFLTKASMNIKEKSKIARQMVKDTLKIINKCMNFQEFGLIPNPIKENYA